MIQRQNLGIGTLILLALSTLGPPAGADTRQDFDCDPGAGSDACTPYVLGTHNLPTAPEVLAGGPSGNFLRLAPAAVPPIVNTVDFPTTDPGNHCRVVVDFDFRIIAGPDPEGPADGLSVSLLNTGVYGDAGSVAPIQPIYVSEEPNFVASLGVGFDIYQNVEPGDVNGRHVSVHWDGAPPLTQTDPELELVSGEFIHARVVLDADASPAEVTVTLTPEGESPTTVIERLAVPGLVPYESRLHFGARSGGMTADHDFDNIVATFDTCSVAAGMVIAEKFTDPRETPGGFPFTGDVAGTVSDGEWITVRVAGPGTYTATEVVPDGWTLVSIACCDDDSSADLRTATATFEVNPGETVICTFTNRVQEPPASCAATVSLSCDAPVVSDNNGAFGSSEIGRYNCLESPYDGPEVVYSFVPSVAGTYDLLLDGLSADLDLVLIGPDVCRSDLCTAASDTSGTGAEALSLDAQAGEEVFIIVDGFGGAVSDYTLEVVCPQAPVAAFVLLPEFPTAGETVRLFDDSENDPTSWLWEFGDGMTATTENPRHTYVTADTYTVTLTVGNAFGSDLVSREIQVAPPATAIGLEGPAGGETGEVLTFNASAQGCEPAAAGWQWLTAGGEPADEPTGETLGVSWSSPGTKLLTVLNSACGDAAGSRSVEITPAPAPAPPEAPQNLEAEAVSSTDFLLRWTDASTDEEAFLVERSRDGGPFADFAVVSGNTTAVEVSVADTPNPTATPTAFRVFALNSAGPSTSSNQATGTTEPESCDPARTLCLLDKRFALEATWRDFTGATGTGKPVALTRDTGYFWFFDPRNVEVMIKVLDGRSVNGHFWVFYGALSNVEYTLRVTDTETGNTRTYVNPAGGFASAGDTEALPGEGLADEQRVRRAAPLRTFAVEAADFTWTPELPVVDQTVLFADRSGIVSPLLNRTWSFGDGSEPLSLIESEVTHLYTTSGSFDVTLEVLDLAGDFFLSRAATRRLQVTPPPDPRISLQAPAEVAAGVQATLAAAANADCSPVRPRGWQWEIGDGVAVGATKRSSIDVVWATAGAKAITVRNSGCSSVSATGVVEVTEAGGPVSVCEPGPAVLCLRDSRFAVTVAWRDFEGNTGSGRVQRISGETGHFWFFNPENVELVVKVLDGRPLNGRFWVFYGALSNVEFTLTVIDTETGRRRTYFNPAGGFASVGDTAALPGE